MNHIKANIVDLWKDGKIVCVTTNGYIKKNGEGVMGRGNALAMAKLIPDLPKALGKSLKIDGLHTTMIWDRIISFPVKYHSASNLYRNAALSRVQYMYRDPDKMIPGYHLKADPELIYRSMLELNQIILEHLEWDNVYLPFPGISNGELSINDIQDSIDIADSRIIFVSLK